MSNCEDCKRLMDALEMMLGALANQKFINEGPTCGDAYAAGPEAYRRKQQEIQEAINRIHRESEDLFYAMKKKVRP